MIERVVGCFRGGQGLLRLSKKHYCTRRYLHHAFWSHGAGNINLPSWWRYLLQKRDHGISRPPPQQASVTTGVAAGLHELFLELLYPMQNHVLIRRLNRATRSNRQATQLAKKGLREYTSIAEDFLARKAGTRHWIKNGRGSQAGDITFQDQSEASNQMAKALMSDIDHPDRYDQLWKLQQDCFEASSPLEEGILKEIFFLLSASKRKIDLERSLALFETLHVKSPLLYDRAVNAALNLKDLETAVDIHHEAATVNPGSIDIGTPAILSYSITHKKWQLAVDTWYRLWRTKLHYYSVQQDLWKKVKGFNLPTLLLKTEEAADFALHTVQSASSSNASGPSHEAVNAAREFAVSMAERVLEVRGVQFRTSQYIKVLDKIVLLSKSSTDIRLQALEQLLSLKDRERFDTPMARNVKTFFLSAIGIYQKLRQGPHFLPSRNLLDELFAGLRTLKSSSGMLMMLEDWKRFVPTKIPAAHYITMAKVVAESGQVDALDQIFDSFNHDYPIEKVSEMTRSKIIHYSLWVHFKRADTASILEKFDQVRSKYGFVPTTKSYNLIMMTFSRVGDVDGAMEWFRSLQESGLAPDPYTYTCLMSMYGGRGDLDAVQGIWREVEENNVEPKMAMMRALLAANLRNDRFQEAEDLVEKATKLDLYGSKTQMWNVLLTAYAARGDLARLSKVHKHMHQVGVAEDSETYTALLLGFAITGNASLAMKIMNVVMPKLRIPRTVKHYAIVMGACLYANDHISVFSLYRDLLNKKLIPDTAVHNVLLRSAAASDEGDSKVRNEEEIQMVHAREVLDVVLKSSSPAEFAGGKPGFLKYTPLDQAQIATYYAYMIHAYGMKASFTKVNELYDEYIATAKGAGKEYMVDDPPAIMFSSLLTAHEAAGNDEEVERCWHFCLEKYKKIAKRSGANLAEPGWVLPARRFVMNHCLSVYLKHLKKRDRVDDMVSTVYGLRQAGYELNSPVWNQYISYLARSIAPKHCYLAFQFCENELMQDWPGWEHLASENARSTKGSWWHMKLVLRRKNRGDKWLPYTRFVYYKTVVMLAAAYADARSGFEVSADDVSREELQKLAPVTVDAVRRMPRIRDSQQNTYLPE